MILQEMKKILKDTTWKLGIFLLWYSTAGYPFRNFGQPKEFIAVFCTFILFDLIKWGLSPEKKEKK